MLGKFYQALQITAVCKDYRVSNTDTEALKFINSITDAGKKPFPLAVGKSKEDLDRKLVILEKSGKRSKGQLDAMRQLYDNPDYLDSMLGTYTQTILPRSREYSFKDIWMSLIN